MSSQWPDREDYWRMPLCSYCDDMAQQGEISIEMEGSVYCGSNLYDLEEPESCAFCGRSTSWKATYLVRRDLPAD